MGRWDTGAITVNGCLQVHIKSFAKHIKNINSIVTGTIDYKNGARIGIELDNSTGRPFLNLIYTVTVKGEKHNINTRIAIVSVPSNLGKGEIYYFVCPFGNKLCKILYMGYGSLYFKCREAYRNRIYYPCQLSSYLDRHNDQYWRLEREIEQLKEKHPKTHYQGKPTAIQQRIKRLKEERDYHEVMRWKILPMSISKIVKAMELPDGSYLV